jgi:G3E family GTPase
MKNSSANARTRATAAMVKAVCAVVNGESMNPIAVTLLTGFLGAGKTTLLRHILNEQHGYKIAVIENEFGEVSVDDQLIGDRATQIKTLTNGCICCSRSNELEDALLDLLDNLDKGNIQFDRLVIECTGMADPGPIIQTFKLQPLHAFVEGAFLL